MTRFDSSYKGSNKRDPEVALFLAGRAPRTPCVIRQFEREIIAPQKIADDIYEILDLDLGTVRFEQLEALTYWHAREPRRIRRRVNTLVNLPELEDRQLVVTVILFTEEGLPPVLPATFDADWTGASFSVRPLYQKLWEMDGARVLEMNWPETLPWVSLMRTPEAVLERAGARIATMQDEELGSQFVTLGSLRYDEDYLRFLLGRFGHMLSTRLAIETPFGAKIFAQGHEKGIEQGIEQGRRQEALRALTVFVRKLYPAFLDQPEWASRDQAEDPHSLMEAIADARDEAAAWSEFLRATRS